MSYILDCPNCGPREVTDFGYGGELNPRPREAPFAAQLSEYNKIRRNITGVQL